jgi:hypothetical protein
MKPLFKKLFLGLCIFSLNLTCLDFSVFASASNWQGLKNRIRVTLSNYENNLSAINQNPNRLAPELGALIEEIKVTLATDSELHKASKDSQLVKA